MSLIPTSSGVLGMIAKASPSEAQMLVEIGLFEVMGDLIDNNYVELQSDLVDIAKAELVAANKEARRIAKADMEAGIEVDPQIFDTLEEIAKSLDDFSKGIGDWFREDKVRRDAKGRFARINTGNNKQARHNMREMRRAGLLNDDDNVQFKRKDGKRVSEKYNETFRSDLRDGFLEFDESNVPRNNKRPEQAAMFDVMRSFTDTGSAARLSGKLSDDQGRFNDQKAMSAARNMTRPTDGTDRRAYRQMQTVGSALRQTTTPGSTTNLVATFAEMTGRMGPEAEDILGPGIRRTAYRYRGVERRPDKKLHESNAIAAQIGDDIDAKMAGTGNFRGAKAAITREILAEMPELSRPGNAGQAVNLYSERLTVPQKVALRAIQEGGSETTPDQIAMKIQGDTAVAGLIGGIAGTKSVLATLPELELSIASGELPPSQGVIINADGRMVTQAHGQRGDHYLPFNLKNLKALQGGQYARTRAMGGPSSEDIYTGLVAGARKLQVVSNTGVFTVDFDPDLRGIRRYSDKARQMVSRYEKLIETVDNNATGSRSLMEQDLSPQIQEEIKQKAWQASGGDEARYKANRKSLTEQAIFEQGLGMTEDGESRLTAARNSAERALKTKSEFANLTNEAREDVRNELINQYLEENEQGAGYLTLNGEGYNRALKTLAQEFPYFISNVEYTPLKEWTRNRGISGEELPSAGLRRRRDAGYKSPAAVESMLANKPRGAKGSQTAPQEEAAAEPSGAVARSTSSASSSVSGDSKSKRPELVKYHVAAKARDSLSPMAIMLMEAEPGAIVTDEDINNGALEKKPFSTRLHYKVKGAGSRQEALQVLTNELMSASKSDRDLLKRYLNNEIAKFQDVDEEKEIEAPMKAINEIADALVPYTSSSDDLHEPDPTDLRPPRIKGAPDPTRSSSKEILAETQSLIIQHPALKDVFEMALSDPEWAPEAIQDIYRNSSGQLDDDDINEVKAINTVWAYSAALSAAKKLEGIIPDEGVVKPGKSQGPLGGQGNVTKSAFRPLSTRPRAESSSLRRVRKSERAPWTPPSSVAKNYQSNLAHRIESLLG